MVTTIDNWLLATVNMWVCDISCREARQLIEDNFDFEQVFEAYVVLCEVVGKKRPTKHKDKGDLKSALEKTAAELVEDIYNLEQGDELICPKFVVSSRSLKHVPMSASSNKDDIAVGARLLSLEQEMKKLSGLEKAMVDLTNSVKDLKDVRKENVAAVPTFAGVAAAAAISVGGQGQQGATGYVRPPGHGQGDVQRSRVGSMGGSRLEAQHVQRKRLDSKRKHDEDGEGEEQQPPWLPGGNQSRRPRKVNYGKSGVTVAGGEAAPYMRFS